MKHRFEWIMVLALAWGCSSPETSTEAAVTPKEDSRLATWVTRIQQDADVLAALNDVPATAPGMIERFVAECDDEAVREAYAARAFRPFLIQADRDDTQTALDVLNHIGAHGSDFVPAHLDTVVTLISEHEKNAKMPKFTWHDDDFDVVRSPRFKAVFDPAWVDDAQSGKTFAALLRDEPSLMPRYQAFLEEVSQHVESVSELDARLDVLLTCDLTQWARVYRLNYPQNDYSLDRFRLYLSDEAVVGSRVRAFLDFLGVQGVQSAFEILAPKDGQYALLMGARRIYTDAIAAGGWPGVEHTKNAGDPVIGKAYPYVPSLRVRLQAEGYAVGDVHSDIFDETIRDAVLLYRDTHQLSDKKLIDIVLFRNLTVGPEQRLETIDLTLQRYRESALGSVDYYVKVNIPDFHGEVWRSGKLLRRFRIVVGNNDIQKDPVTKKPVPDPDTLYPLYPNRTPLQTSKLNEIIYQPYWNVPARIRIEELEPKLAANPNYYIENNYEEVNVGNPRLYYVRELPNPKNSLGKVKFMYPNPHATFLHDTPAKALFRNPVRAYSHGCMRVQDPLELAKLLLEQDGQWNEAKVDAILSARPGVETSIYLNRPVDIDIVYLNARVDDSGVVAFLSDIYSYDAVRLGKIELKKLPRPK
ncbi:MAG: L,D-transpeptidase family protein [Proteobacteria bacterium]|nr:L,D-transpeptidase family protein [Pseudomonadota bacterium]